MSLSNASSTFCCSSVDGSENNNDFRCSSEEGDTEANALQTSRSELICGVASKGVTTARDIVEDSQETKKHVKNLRSSDVVVISAAAVYFVKAFWYKSSVRCAQLVNQYIKNGVAKTLIRTANQADLDDSVLETLLLAVNTLIFHSPVPQTVELFAMGLLGLLEVTLVSTCPFCRCGALQLLINVLTVETLRDELLEADILELVCEVSSEPIWA
jgi:hypothetical protein